MKEGHGGHYYPVPEKRREKTWIALESSQKNKYKHRWKFNRESMGILRWAGSDAPSGH